MTTDQLAMVVGRITARRQAAALKVRGIYLVREKSTGRRYAMVRSSNGITHYKVTATTCECVGHFNRGYCSHHDAVMLMLHTRAAHRDTSVAA